MHSMVRIMVFDRLDNYLCDIEPDHIVDAKYTDEVNGEHSITITTTQMLEKTNRLLIRDGMGIWHEYVVLGIVCTHENKHTVINEYYCIWSLQYDLSATFINGPYDCGIVPGHASIPQLPRTALEVSIGGTSRWVIGTITVTTMAAASFYRRSGWEGLQPVIEKWGGEIQATITVGANGVVSRAVDLLSHVGSSVATRRFDYGHDIKGIKRTVSDDVWPCRIVPLGKAQETENGGYTRRPSIESVNDGIMWIQDDDAAPFVRIRNPEGEWEYPTVIVYNDTYEEPADLLAWAIEHKSEYTRPKVTYQASLAQFVRAGLHPHGIALGDEVVAVDRTFGDDGLRITARVVKIVGNLLDPSDTTLTIGNIGDSFTDHFAGLSRQVSQIADAVSRTQQYQSTAEYVDNLLTRINGEVNATGGYFYITQGEGVRTYDRAVSDPLVGSEATQVVEMRGGNIRIANSRTSGGDWDWKTLIQSGHIAANLVTAVNIIAGYIGNVSGSHWDLDNNELVIASGATIGDRTVQQALSDIDDTITGVDVEYASNQSATTAPSSGWSTTPPAWQSGYYIWSRTATTTADGTTYSTPVMISGRDGVDGQDGDDGLGISSVTIRYGTSNSASTQPSSWSSSSPTSIAKGSWLWVRTVTAYTDGTSTTTYAKSYIGADGADGTSVTILGSYASYAALIAAHPTGSAGDAYLVDGYLYVWSTDTSDWENVGNIQGPAGTPGTSVTVSSIEYGTSNSASTQPSSWSTTAPTSITKGKWLWIKTTYSDSSVAMTKSYVGTDGEDGKSVYVQSSTKSGGTTTVVLTDGTTTNTLTINDGTDGDDGTPGANGLNGYVHVAWATSADGSQGFSTSVSTGKTYIGVYTDNTQADSQSYSAYSWSLIKGADGTNGQDGADGIGITSIVEQYYLSTSNSTQTGGSWSTSQPTWASGKYIWTRSEITWDTTPATKTTTTPVLAKALNGANATAASAQADATQALSDASDAAKVATNYLTYSSSAGLDVGYSGTNAKTRVTGSGVEVFDGDGVSALFAGLQNGNSIVRVGRASGSGNVVMSSDGSVDVRSASTLLAHFGYGEGKNVSGGTTIAPYYNIGIRYPNSVVGNYSVAEGYRTKASGYLAHAEGQLTTASGNISHAEGDSTTASGYRSHAEGLNTTASSSQTHAEGDHTTAGSNASHAEGGYTETSNQYAHAEGYHSKASNSSAHAEGYYCEASGAYSHAEGYYTQASGSCEHACGMYNISGSSYLISAGRGTSSGRANAMYLASSGSMWIAGNLTQNSDRRLKEHHSYLGDDAAEFVKALKPALFTKDGERHVGFYAQDVRNAEPADWDTVTVTEQHTDETLGYDPLTLDYTALIAPLTAYAQQLERRVEELERLVRGGEA